MSYIEEVEGEETPKVKFINVAADYINGRTIGEQLSITLKGNITSFAAAEESGYNPNELCLDIKSIQIEDGTSTIFEELADED